MKYCKLKRLNKLKKNCYNVIDRISSFAERVELNGQTFGECASDERLQQRQTIAFHQLDRINKLIAKL